MLKDRLIALHFKMINIAIAVSVYPSFYDSY